jgi:hypothetical protein
MTTCEATGIYIFPWISGFIPDLSAFDQEKTHRLDVYKTEFGDSYITNIPNRYWVHMGGRALDTYRSYFGNLTLKQVLDDNPAGCSRELSDTSHFHIDLFGNYIPGLCSGIAIDIDDLGTPLAEERYPIIHTLFHSGVNGLLQLARERYGYRPEENGYINKCDLCTCIRFFLVNRNDAEHAELRPKEFYTRELNN